MTQKPSSAISALPMENENPTFDQLMKKYAWKEIENCPGRYLLVKDDHQRLRSTTPKAFLDNRIPIEIFSSEVCRDRVHIGQFSDGGGLLSYEKSDGSFVHTLNSCSGLQRKTNHLQISLTNPRPSSR